jgi:DNA-binding Lrp family transcriptional regulator
MNELQKRLLDDFQHDFPLSPTPYADLALALGVSEQEVLHNLRLLKAQGKVSRVGPVFRPHSIGASTLAAMRVPAPRLEAVAELINGYPEVNHNYEREHEINLWFVATAPDETHLQRVLDDIAARSGLSVMSLPLLEDFHIDLGFKLHW